MISKVSDGEVGEREREREWRGGEGVVGISAGAIFETAISPKEYRRNAFQYMAMTFSTAELYIAEVDSNKVGGGGWIPLAAKCTINAPRSTAKCARIAKGII